MDLQFKEIGTFHPKDQTALERELSQFESNVADALTRAEKLASSPLKPTNLKTTSYTASVGELVVTNTALVSFTVTLPVATAENAGKEVGVIRQSAANTLTTRAASGSVMGATTDTVPAAIGLYIYLSDGIGWWRR